MNLKPSVWHDNCNRYRHKPIKTNTDMTISRTARVWVNEIRNKKTIHDTADYFKGIFTKDEYDEFLFELMDQTKECVKLEFETLNIMPMEESTLNEIFIWMDEHINYFDLIDNIINSVNNEIFQTVTGFFGTDCDDKQFEEVRDAMGDFSWDELMDVYEYLLTEEKPKVSDWMGYVKHIESKLTFALPAVAADKKAEVVTNITEKFFSTEILSATLNRRAANLVYAIMNTSYYDGGMGIIIVDGVSPRILTDYGFENNEIEAIAQMKVGESFKDTAYGNGVVVVRMA